MTVLRNITALSVGSATEEISVSNASFAGSEANLTGTNLVRVTNSAAINTAYNASAGHSKAYLDSSSPTAHQLVKAIIRRRGSADETGNFPGVLARARSAAGDTEFYAILACYDYDVGNPAPGGRVLLRTQAGDGTWTTQNSAAVARLGADSEAELSLEVSGTSPNITCVVKWAGSTVITKSDLNISALNTAGKGGLHNRSFGGCSETAGLHYKTFYLEDDPPAGDTTPPDITSDATGATNGPFSVNLAENSTAVFITLTSSEALSAVTKGGADGALFTLAGSGLTRTLAPASAFNFESLPHANPFVVTLTFEDTATPANSRTVTINVTVTNVNEAPTFNGGGSNISVPTLVVGTPMTPIALAGRWTDPEAGALTYGQAGSWPPGISVSGGNIEGTPTTPGTYSGLTATASDGTNPAVPSNTFSITVIGPATLSGDAQLGGLSASGTLAQQAGTLALIDFENWANNPLASFTIPVVSVCRAADGVQVLTLLNQNVNALRNLSISNVAIIAGQPYVVAGWDLAGANYFIERVVAT